MLLINKFNKKFRFSLSIIDIYSKYIAWFTSLKDKKGITITNPFQKNLNESSAANQITYG